MEIEEKKGDKILKQIAMALSLLIAIIISSSLTAYYEGVANENVVKALFLEKDFSSYYASLKNAETGQRGFLLTLDSIYLDDYYNGLETFIKTSKDLENTTLLTEEEKEAIVDINRFAESKFKELDKTIELASGYHLEEALDIIDTDKGKNIMDTITNKFNSIRRSDNISINETRAKAESYQVLSNIIATVGLILIFYIAFNIILQIRPLVDELIENKKILQNNIKTLSIKNKQLENFAYIASHDLKEPLRTVTNFVDLLEEEGAIAKLNENEAYYFSFIKKATSRMDGLINGLLTYSKIGQSGEIASLDMNHIVEMAKSNLHANLKASGIDIKTKNLPTVYGHEIELIQLIQNLLANAIKFSNNSVKKVIEITCEEEYEFWKFSVKDYGIGIPKEKLNDIFKFMTKLHREDDYAGYGLGLSFCEKVVHLHYGTIWVESEINQGSTFYFKLSKKLNQ